LTDYYQILGLSQSASASEIKAAFRSLAKLYHPDKNPGGQEHFRLIMLAYETLSDPARKYAYDARLRYLQSVRSSQKNTGGKSWTFEEKEMRRRQYYNEHIKKYEKKNRAKTQHAELKKSYNEYKYILFATPLAVLLFLLVVNFAERKEPAHSPAEETSQAENRLSNGDFPYSSYFGKPRLIADSGIAVQAKNLSGYDIVLVFFSGGQFVRGLYLRGGFSVTVSELPASISQIRVAAGYGWQNQKSLLSGRITGGFSEPKGYYIMRSALPQFQNEITLTPSLNGFIPVSEQDFFELP
jgi:curved DNA-binding protein CbpA